MSAINDRLGECEVCGVQAAKYTCPKCEVKTCCLNCVNIHKKELECNGVRDKTKYVPLKKFTNLDLLSDYRLLEDINRSVETMKKDKLKRYTRMNKDLPRHLYLLRETLRKRQIILKYMPANFKRHRENSTYLDFKAGKVYWKIQWVFVHAEHLVLVEKKCDENLKLSHVLDKYFNPRKCDIKQLNFYQSAGLNGVNLYLRAENKPGNKYYNLDLHSTLTENLESKVIIEHPVIHVVFKDQSEMYNAHSIDDEIKMEINPSNATSYVSALVHAEEKQNTNRKRNLLFVTEYSDEEMSTDGE